MQKKSYVLLDTNVWMTERLLQSTVAHALLFAMTKDSAILVLPEIVELEIAHNYKKEAEKAIASIDKDTQFLSQLLRKTIKTNTIPGQRIEIAIQGRFSELTSILLKKRVTKKGNEQAERQNWIAQHRETIYRSPEGAGKYRTDSRRDVHLRRITMD